MPRCKICGREVEHLSARRVCIDCGVKRMAKARREIAQRQGKFYDSWIVGMAKAVDRELKRGERESDPKEAEIRPDTRSEKHGEM